MAENKFELKTYLEGDIFDVLGLTSLEQKEKEEIVETITQTVYARVILQINTLLTQSDRLIFSELDAGGLESFLKEREIDFKLLVTEEALRYRQEIISVFTYAKDEYFAKLENSLTAA